ncbi:MAG TPA: hypothetical protein VF941_16590 [Clostridia bacterium]
MLRTIETKYRNDIRPAWTIKGAINHRARFVRQSSCPGHCAVFDFIIEPYLGYAPAVFENKAELSQALAGKSGWDEIFDQFVERIYKSIGEVLDEFYDNMRPIIGVSITLRDIYIHEVDSREMSFKIATHIAMKEILTDENLVEIFD